MKKSLPIRFRTHTLLLPIMLITVLLGNLLSIPRPASAIPETAILAENYHASLKLTVSLQEFRSAVVNGQRDTVVGVYIPGLLALPVGQQPKGKSGYVTREPEKATQFGLASKYGTIGILAHNDLAGADFSGIRQNQYAIVVFGDGRLEYFVFGEVQKYQALSPTSTFSDFINQDGTKERLTASQLFSRIYGQSDRLVLQTCIKAHGDPSWGRMFLIARPATNRVLSVIQQTSFVLEVSSFGLAAR